MGVLETFIRNFIFKWECEFDSQGNVVSEKNPKDPGGLTKFGIDQRSHPDMDIESLTDNLAVSIYMDEYKRDGCDSFFSPLDLAFFDTAVNSGATRARLCLQRALEVTADGVIGPQTKDALLKVPPAMAAAGLIDQRDKFYIALAEQKTYSDFLNGWLNRTHDLRKYLKLGVSDA